jgi:hypothetical protein
MGFLRRAWEALLATQRPPPVYPRMSVEELEGMVRAALADRGGVYPEERIYPEPYDDAGRVLWDVFVRRPEFGMGGHIHLIIDDATGATVKRWDVSH